jgi:hypothetical protein
LHRVLVQFAVTPTETCHDSTKYSQTISRPPAHDTASHSILQLQSLQNITPSHSSSKLIHCKREMIRRRKVRYLLNKLKRSLNIHQKIDDASIMRTAIEVIQRFLPAHVGVNPELSL